MTPTTATEIQENEDTISHLHLVAATLRSAGFVAIVEGDHVTVCLSRPVLAREVAEVLDADEITDGEMVRVAQDGRRVCVVVL